MTRNPEVRHALHSPDITTAITAYHFFFKEKNPGNFPFVKYMSEIYMISYNHNIFYYFFLQIFLFHPLNVCFYHTNYTVVTLLT